MKLLLDTHAFLWYVWGDAQMSKSAKALIDDPNNETLLSPASWWEIAIKVSIGKLTLAEPYGSFMQRETQRFSRLDITLDHLTIVASLLLHHRDPFDRLLVAQAMIEQIPIVSGGPKLDQYPGTRLW